MLHYHGRVGTTSSSTGKRIPCGTGQGANRAAVYDHVDLDQVWRMTTDELSELIEAVEPLIQEEA
jgi:hypothetical protein